MVNEGFLLNDEEFLPIMHVNLNIILYENLEHSPVRFLWTASAVLLRDIACQFPPPHLRIVEQLNK